MNDVARQPDLNLAGDRQLVVAIHVVPIGLDHEMQGAVDLDPHNASGRANECRVEIATATARVTANDLSSRGGQPVSATEPSEVNLADGLRAATNVLEGGSQQPLEPDLPSCLELV